MWRERGPKVTLMTLFLMHRTQLSMSDLPWRSVMWRHQTLGHCLAYGPVDGPSGGQLAQTSSAASGTSRCRCPHKNNSWMSLCVIGSGPIAVKRSSFRSVHRHLLTRIPQIFESMAAKTLLSWNDKKSSGQQRGMVNVTRKVREPCAARI